MTLKAGAHGIYDAISRTDTQHIGLCCSLRARQYKRKRLILRRAPLSLRLAGWDIAGGTEKSRQEREPQLL